MRQIAHVREVRQDADLARTSIAARFVALLAASSLAASSLAACTAADGTRPGAHPQPTRTGPTMIRTAEIPALAARATMSDDEPPVRQTGVQRLSNEIDASLTRPGRVTPATRIIQKTASGNQLRIQWTVGLSLVDAGARLRVRTDAIKILTLVRASGLAYGSVLLLAVGATVSQGKKTVSIVVRAKYTKPLVHATNWAAVSPAKILTMPDDKPAIIAAGYR